LGLNKLNKREDNNENDRWDLTKWDLDAIEGPDEVYEFTEDIEEEEEEYDPYLEVVEGIDDEEYETRRGVVAVVLRATALLLLVFFFTVFTAPSALRAVRDVFRRPASEDYLSSVLVDGQPLIFKGSIVHYSFEIPSGYPVSEIERLVIPVLKAMDQWEQALGGRLKFEPGKPGEEELLIHFVTDLQTAGMATIRPGVEYRPEIYLRLNVPSPLPQAAIAETIALHELGHAIGLWGHSDFDGDVMYPIAGRGVLSQRDIKTVRRLYGVEEKRR